MPFIVCGFIVLLTSRLTLLFICPYFLVIFNIAITSHSEKRAALHASCAFICLSSMRNFFVVYSLSLGVRGWLRLIIVALSGLFCLRLVTIHEIIYI